MKYFYFIITLVIYTYFITELHTKYFVSLLEENTSYISSINNKVDRYFDDNWNERNRVVNIVHERLNHLESRIDLNEEHINNSYINAIQIIETQRRQYE